MEDIKIIFFDVDGTLIDMETKVVSEKVVETLHALQKRGIIICLATGRTLSAIPKVEGVTFDAFLTFNGSYCCTQDTRIFHNPIPTKDVYKVVENAKKINRPLCLASLARRGANGVDQDLADYFWFSKDHVEVVDDFETLMNDDIYQIMMGLYQDEYEELLDDVEGAEITAWWDRAVDIIPKGGGKGLGVEKMLEFYGFSKEQSLAFGDGSNDYDMLQAVGTGVAMGNATEDVKEIADVICRPVCEDGVYHYCKDNGLI